jgi:hypothetical protein
MNKKTISIDDFEQTTTVISEEATKAVKGGSGVEGSQTTEFIVSEDLDGI